MKKSKIIIPALGVILLTTAASVSGTVAWFRATRDVQVSMANFGLKDIDGSLKVTATNVIGTKATNGATTSVEMEANNYLTDGSYGLTNNTKAYRLDKSTGEGFIEYDTTEKWKILTTTGSPAENYYVAVRFKLTFEYTFSGDNRDMNLYFDAKSSTLTGDGAAGAKDSRYGFRVALESASNGFVWSNDNAKADTEKYNTGSASKVFYVNGTASTATAEFAANKVIHELDNTFGDAKDCKDADSDSQANYAGELLGVISKGAGEATTGTLDVNVTAWFEGTDPNVVNETELAKMAAQMSFFVRVKA